MYSQIIQRMRQGAYALATAYTFALMGLSTRMRARRAGQSTLEWALIALLIAVVAYAAYQFLGKEVADKVSDVGKTVEGTSGTPTPATPTP